jgi:hypothetical protein
MVFDALYRNVLLRGDRVISFETSNHIVLRTGFISSVEKSFNRCFEQLTLDSAPLSAIEIHQSELARNRQMWFNMRSSSTCLCCLRRRPQYGLPCGHCLCENCVILFGNCSDQDPWVFRIQSCFLCGEAVPDDITVRTHPPTAGVGVLCIDGGGTRGIVPLTIMKMIQERLGTIPLQRCVTVGFGVSIGKSICPTTRL